MILLTGAGGRLGGELKRLLPEEIVLAPNRSELDLSNIDSVEAYVSKKNVTAVIFCAAWTDVEGCEGDHQRSMKQNLKTVKNLAAALSDTQPRWIYVSSTGVYGDNGNTHPNCETSNTTPVTHHHKMKLLAEKVVLHSFQSALIVRTGWLFGQSDRSKMDFLRSRLNEASKSKQLLANQDQVGNPTYIPDLAKQIIALQSLEIGGVVNCVGFPPVSRYQFVRTIVEEANFDCEVLPVHKNYFGRKAPVADNESAENSRLKAEQLLIMRPWIEGVKEEVIKALDQK